MAKGKKQREPAGELSKAEYADALYALQVELVKLQKHLIEGGERIVVLLEGRHAAGSTHPAPLSAILVFRPECS